MISLDKIYVPPKHKGIVSKVHLVSDLYVLNVIKPLGMIKQVVSLDQVYWEYIDDMDLMQLIEE